ncbi:hypothetical protein R1flu_025242 [Riccia fluitans]|uniref:Uncharacterized protein n=1 Tax=Riccia fluitans TaxID=41844 RepID=A0ABD1XX72_9MARC
MDIYALRQILFFDCTEIPLHWREQGMNRFRMLKIPTTQTMSTNSWNDLRISGNDIIPSVLTLTGYR